MDYKWPEISAILSIDSERCQLFQAPHSSRQNIVESKNQIFVEEVEFGQYPSDLNIDEMKRAAKNDESINISRSVSSQVEHELKQIELGFEILSREDLDLEMLQNAVQLLKSGEQISAEFLEQQSLDNVSHTNTTALLDYLSQEEALNFVNTRIFLAFLSKAVLAKIEVIPRELQGSLIAFSQKKPKLFVEGVFFTLLRNHNTGVSMGDLMFSIVEKFGSAFINSILYAWSNMDDLIQNPLCSVIECNVLTSIISMNHNVDNQTVSSFVSCLVRISEPNANSKKFGMLITTFAKKHSDKMPKDMLEALLTAADSLATFFKKTASNVIKKSLAKQY